MTPTRALIALLVWLRASERISVSVLLGMSKSGFVVLEWNDFARRGIGMSFGKGLRPNCRAKGRWSENLSALSRDEAAAR
jgi:hypothetical protein